jgi:hypothetical protein
MRPPRTRADRRSGMKKGAVRLQYGGSWNPTTPKEDSESEISANERSRKVSLLARASVGDGLQLNVRR